MKIRTLIFLSSILLLSDCGGSSGNDSNSLNGFWKGELLQTSLSCGGQPVAACTGCKARDILLYITGATDSIGSEIHIEDDECQLLGTQTDDGFEAVPTSDCAASTMSMSFRLREDGSAYVTIASDSNTEDVVGCVGTYGAELFRDELQKKAPLQDY